MGRIFDFGIFPFLLIPAVPIASYFYSSHTATKQITVQQKYQTHRHESTRFYVVDETGEHYVIPRNLWWRQWDVNERFVKVQEGTTYKITYYGGRFPLFGLYPGIVNMKEIPYVSDTGTNDAFSKEQYSRLEAKLREIDQTMSKLGQLVHEAKSIAREKQREGESGGEASGSQ